MGAGQRQHDPRAAVEWLADWADNGLLALNAFQGYFHMPRLGTENIKRLLFAPDRSRVAIDLGPILPSSSDRGTTKVGGFLGTCSGSRTSPDSIGAK